MLALTLLMNCASALAAEGQQKKQRGKPDTRPELLTMEEKVAESKFIFVGEGVRIYFIDPQYREAPYIRAADAGTGRSAILVVKVLKVLHPAGAERSEPVLVPITTSKDVFADRSPYDAQVARHVGKKGIWFGEFETRRDYGDPRAPRPLENPVTLFKAGSWSAKQGPTANPLPDKQLKEVEDTIGRVRGGAKPAAPPAKNGG